MVRRLLLGALALVLLGACSCSDGAGIDGGAARPDASSARDAFVPRTDGGTVRLPDAFVPDAGADAGAPDGGVTEPTAVRFVVMGDTGEGNTAQHEVADAIAATCAVDGCDFVMLLGDNIYDSGVDSTSDDQWRTKFEEPYADLDLPFYAVLGNHDYGGTLLGSDYGGLGNEFDKGPIEVAYTDVSTKWTMLDTHYTFRIGNVGFVMLDTNSILWDDDTNGDQRAWFPGAVAALRAEGAEWILAAGHHPVISNGAHGNAGSYESIEVGGTDVPIPVPILRGENVEAFFDEVLCGEVDAYFAGHDHNRQWFDEPGALCGAELIVSGAGAKTKDFDNTERNATHFQDADLEGFLYVVIDGDSFYGRWVDRTGATNFERMTLRRGL